MQESTMNTDLFRVVKLVLNLSLFNTLYVSLSIEIFYLRCVYQNLFLVKQGQNDTNSVSPNAIIARCGSAATAAAEKVRQLQHPRWQISFQFEMRIRINCMLTKIGVQLIACFYNDISVALAINFRTQPLQSFYESCFLIPLFFRPFISHV